MKASAIRYETHDHFTSILHTSPQTSTYCQFLASPMAIQMLEAISEENLLHIHVKDTYFCFFDSTLPFYNHGSGTPTPGAISDPPPSTPSLLFSLVT